MQKAGVNSCTVLERLCRCPSADDVSDACDMTDSQTPRLQVNVKLHLDIKQARVTGFQVQTIHARRSPRITFHAHPSVVAFVPRTHLLDDRIQLLERLTTARWSVDIRHHDRITDTRRFQPIRSNSLVRPRHDTQPLFCVIGCGSVNISLLMRTSPPCQKDPETPRAPD